MRKILLASVALLSIGSVRAAYLPEPHGNQLFTASGSFVVSAGVYQVFFDGCATGGFGGGGQASAATAGAGGGSAGTCMRRLPYAVAPGATLTLTLPAVPTGQTAAGATGAAGSSVTISGGLYGETVALRGGAGGLPGAAGVGGVGGASAFSSNGFGGLAGGAAGTVGAANSNAVAGAYGPINIAGYVWDGLPGGGGGATAGVAGGGGFWLTSSAGRAAAGSGNGAGGGGGGSLFGAGQAGTAAGVDCSGTPTFVGYGGGGCGGGTNGKGGPGGPPFVNVIW